MNHRPTPASELAERLCRPQRVAVFGHRGVGKTTLLTMLYREAGHGRLPGLRLAAGDARTADYLADRVVQLEAGQLVAATLSETDLSLQLYHQQTRLELLVKDYQGEHVELARDGSLQEFLRDCDAVWLCLELGAPPDPAQRLTRQQEIERLIEDYLAAEPSRGLQRPIALVLTKADLADTALDALEPDALHEEIDKIARAHFGITRHTLQLHCPASGLCAVSSLKKESGIRSQGSGVRSQESEAADLDPWNLHEPLIWLAKSLQARDAARLDELFEATSDLTMLQRCVDCFTHRYPDAPRTHAQELKRRGRRRTRRRVMAGCWSILALTLGLWGYDTVGYQNAVRFEEEHASDPAAARDNWRRFQGWHPTRQLLGASTADDEAHRLSLLDRLARDQERDGRLAELRQNAANPDTDPEALWRRFVRMKESYPELNVASDIDPLRDAVKARRDQQVAERAGRAFIELEQAAQRTLNLPAVIAQADRFLQDFPQSVHDSDVRQLRRSILYRLDEQDIEVARRYSTQHPLNFQTRRELFQRYLDQHPGGGAFAAEAQRAIDHISRDWDRHDFRAIRDHFLNKPGEVGELVLLCRRYLAVQPKGMFRNHAEELLRFSEKITVTGEYRVTLRKGHFDKSVARTFSKGPKISVELEVAGIRYGPSTIVYNEYEPVWDFEFPRPIRWKLGDPVIVRVREHSWTDRILTEFAASDPLALHLLNYRLITGDNWISLETDFRLPALPDIE